MSKTAASNDPDFTSIVANPSSDNSATAASSATIETEAPNELNIVFYRNFSYKHTQQHLPLVTAFAHVNQEQLVDPKYRTNIDESLAQLLTSEFKNYENQKTENPDYAQEKPYINTSTNSVYGLAQAFEKKLSEVGARFQESTRQIEDFGKRLNDNPDEQPSEEIIIANQLRMQLENAIKQFDKVFPLLLQGYASLHFAAHYNLPGTLSALLNLGAEPNLPAVSVAFEDSRCQTTLDYLLSLKNSEGQNDLGVSFIKSGGKTSLLTTPMLILANIADEVVTQNMKGLLNNEATLRYEDAYVYYAQIYKTISENINNSEINSEDLAELHSDLFVFCLKQLINNKDNYIPQLKELVEEYDAKKSQSGLSPEEEQNLQDLKKGLQDSVNLQNNFLLAIKNILKADPHIHNSNQEYKNYPYVTSATPVKRLIGLPDLENETVEMLLHLGDRDFQGLLSTDDAKLKDFFQLTDDVQLKELLSLKAPVNCTSRDQIPENVKAFDYIRIIYNQIEAKISGSASLQAGVINEQAFAQTENTSILGKSFADLNVDDFE